MDFNILIPSIAKTLGVPAGTTEQKQILSQKLMDVVSQHKHLVRGVRKLEIEVTDLKMEVNDKSRSETALIDLLTNNKLSRIVRDKNKKIIADHDIIIDYTEKKVTYPKVDNLNRRNKPGIITG